jgi:di/tricarboxylate transporter
VAHLGTTSPLSPDTLFVFGLAAVATVMLATDRVRFDMVALLVVLSLAASGVLTEREALAGFGSPVVLIVAGLLVVGKMLTRTGIASMIGEWMARAAGDSEIRLLVLLMLVAGVLGSVMSSTAVVAILIPVVANTAAQRGLSVSRLLMPMSYGALISGMLTLIGTPANLVVSGELESAGRPGFGFFAFLPVGAAILIVATVYMVWFGRHLLPSDASPVQTPAAGMRDLFEEFGLLGTFHRLEVPASSPLAGRTLREAALSDLGLRVNIVERRRRVGVTTIPDPGADLLVRAGDTLVVQGESESVESFERDVGLVRRAIEERERRQWVRTVGVATLLVHPESKLVGKSLADARFREQFGLQVLALRRKGALVPAFATEKLRVGDSLFVQGAWRRIERLREHPHDFVVITLPEEARQLVPEREKAPIAAGILVAMIGLSASGLVPVSVAVLAAAAAAVGTGCISMEEGYRAIHWRIVVLLAGMIPLADALEKTGGVALIVDGLVGTVGGAGPYMMLAALFGLSAGLSMVMSNTATAVLVAPIAIAASEAIGAAPEAFVMAVAIAASAAFASPVASPVVALVAEPGRYRFVDFLKVGMPLLLMTWVLTVALTPLVFPF